MVDEFRELGCTRLSIALREGPYDWEALEAFAARSCDGADRRSPPQPEEELMLNPGDKAPDFAGRDHTGKTVKLSELKGKTVVLWFYPKADTPG